MGDFLHAGYAALALALVIALWGIWMYNRLIALHRLVDEAWSGIAVQLKRRHDLIPNLVATVKGYAAHEQGVLEEVTRLRSEAMAEVQAAGTAGSDAGRGTLARTENALGSALGRVLLLAERYPDLHASEGFLSLQHALAETEDQLQMARRYYNGTVRNYVTSLGMFPNLLIGKLFSFAPMAFFELDSPADAKSPEISL